MVLLPNNGDGWDDMSDKIKKSVANDGVRRTSVRVLEDEFVKRVRGHGRKDVGQRCDRGIPAPTGSRAPDGNRGQTPAHIARGVCGH